MTGRVTDHHRLVAEQPAHPEFLDQAIERLEVEVERRLSPFREELALIVSVVPQTAIAWAADGGGACLGAIGPCLRRSAWRRGFSSAIGGSCYRDELNADGICSAIKSRVVSVVRP